LHDDISARAQGRYGLLLPKIGHNHWVEGRAASELFGDRLHARMIAHAAAG
jgi:hypothetical protein